MLTKSQVCRHLLAMQQHGVNLMSLCYLLLYSVLLPLGNMAAPRGRPISVVWAEILLFGQMDTAGTISPSSSLHVCPPRGHLTSAHFDEHVFFFFFWSKLSLLCFSQIKCSLKVDYKDYLETWFLYK